MKKQSHFLTNCIPLQPKALHFFCGRQQSLLTFALPAYKYLLGKKMRLRMVVHGGNGLNYLSNLKEYGLPTDLIRQHLERRSTENEITEWLEAQRASENARIL